MFLLGLLFINSESVAGSGAGGRIQVENQTGENISVTWSGVGCAGGYKYITLVCQGAEISPGGEYSYGYNWGVTETWLNIATQGADIKVHRCLEILLDVLENECTFEHHTVDTDAWKTDICVLTKEGNFNYRLVCRR